MHCMYCGMPKGTSRAEAMSNSEKIKPVVLAVIKLRLSEGISKAVSQSVAILLKFHSNFLEVFQVILKALLGLVMLNQYCQDAMKVL